MQETKEKFLIFRVRRFRDQRAFKELLAEYGSEVDRFLRFKLPTVEDAEDAFNTVCFRVWNYAISSDVDHFRGLIYTLAKNIVAEYYRSRKMTDSLERGDGSEIEVASKESGEKIIASSELSLLPNVLRRLKEEYQEVIMMRFLEDMTIHEMAKRLGKTENHIRVLIHRATKALKEIVEK